MADIFGTLGIATRGMAAQTLLVKTTSHNISNADTEGFSKQRVNIEASNPYREGRLGMIGTGVEVTSITRLREEYLDEQIRFENSANGTFNALQSVLGEVEIAFLEPSTTGLKATMGEMWNAWQELSKSAASSTARTLVEQNSQTFTDTLNHMATQMETLQTDTVSTIEGKVYKVNNLLGEIQDLSDRIYQLKTRGMEPNDLLDKRDLKLDQLSAMININVESDQFGRIKITEADTNTELINYDTKAAPTNEMSVIRSATYDDDADEWTVELVKNGDISDVHSFTFSGATYPGFEAGDIVLTKPDNWQDYIDETISMPTLTSVNLRQGEIAGNIKSLTKVKEYEDQLDRLAFGVAQAVNLIHKDDGSGSYSGIDFFTSEDGTSDISAKNIRVNSLILNDLNLINAKGNSSDASGAGGRALAIAQLQNTRLPIGDSDVLKAYLTSGKYDPATMSITSDSTGTTFSSFYSDVVTKIGIDSKQAQDGVENQTNLLLQLNERKESVSGVSIDEEVANLVQFQNVYAANAKVVSTLVDMLDTLINRMGV